MFLGETGKALSVHCMSFGYKYGVPPEADLVFDVRCLPNPYYIPELKSKTGLDKEVRDYVMQWDSSRELADRQRLADRFFCFRSIQRKEKAI